MKKVNLRHNVIIVLLLLVVVLSASYAYWTAVIRNYNTPMNLQASDLKIVFEDSSEIKASNVEPGWGESKTFTVESKSDKDFEYNIVIKNLVNTFLSEGYLQYKITSSNGYNMTEFKDVPKSNNEDTIISDLITISPKEIQEYTIEFIYRMSEEDQSMDMGKAFSGKLAIEGKKDGTPFYSKLLADHAEVMTRTDFSTPVGGSDFISEPTSTGVIYKTIDKTQTEDGTTNPIYYFAGNAVL